MVHDGAHIQRSGNGCRREMILSRENAFQLDSWDNAFAMRSADYLQATGKIIWERQTGVISAWALERLFWMR
jgi:hypothetical protein